MQELTEEEERCQTMRALPFTLIPPERRVCDSENKRLEKHRGQVNMRESLCSNRLNRLIYPVEVTK